MARFVWDVGVEEAYKECTCCGRELKPGKKVWLELDQRYWVYHDFGGVPDELSQGYFPFGSACADRKRKEARKRLP